MHHGDALHTITAHMHCIRSLHTCMHTITAHMHCIQSLHTCTAYNPSYQFTHHPPNTPHPYPTHPFLNHPTHPEHPTPHKHSMVSSQLQKFERDMARDAAVQRAQVQRLVADAVAQVEGLVDDALKISNIDVISTYMLGTKEDASKLPATQQLQQGAAEEVERLKGVVVEHSNWIRMNCDAQVQYYRCVMWGCDVGGGCLCGVVVCVCVHARVRWVCRWCTHRTYTQHILSLSLSLSHTHTHQTQDICRAESS